MGAIRILTTDDCLRYSCDVGVQCPSCGRLAVFCAIEWEERFGRSLAGLGRRLRCSGCGARDVKVRAVNECERPKVMPLRISPLYVRHGRKRSGR
jgi:hypothetical protein